MAEVGRGIDPTQDVAGILDGECFLCGKGRLVGSPCDADFGPDGQFQPRLPAHKACLRPHFTSRGISRAVLLEYQRRIADLVSVRRFA